MNNFIRTDCRICTDKASHQYGWIFIRDKDGTWVAAGTLSDKVINIALEAIKAGKPRVDSSPSYSYHDIDPSDY